MNPIHQLKAPSRISNSKRNAVRKLSQEFARRLQDSKCGRIKPGHLLNVRSLGVFVAVALVATFLTVNAFMQEKKHEPAPELTVENAAIAKEQGAHKEKKDAEEPSPDILAPSPNVITAGTYAFTSATGAALEDMSTGTTMLLTPDLDDAASTIAPIGFDFWFDGVRQTQFSANANGLMRLGSTVVSTAFTNDLASATNVPQIAAYWDDLWIGNNGKVHYKLVGSAPNRKLVVEWKNEQAPRVATATSGSATYQAWLYESTGKMEFVYGDIPANAANGGYSVGFGSAAIQFASVTTTGPTVAYGTANNAQTNAIAAGTKYTFTPLTPADPGALSFTAVGLNAMTLNWADNATTELGYAIYRSFDGSNYEFIAQTAANATSSAQSGLASNTTYFWKVYAVTEGSLSGASSASQATATGTLSGTKTIGPTGNYATIAAAITDINTNGLAGSLILELQTTYVSSAETFPLAINAVGSPSNTITLQPTTGATALSITSAATTQTLNLNGAAYITIDGRAGGTGASQLTVANTATSGVPIQLINDARNNTLKFVSVAGVNTAATGGDIVFSTTTGAIGNSFNTIDNCDIKDGATTPANGIFSLGTSSAPNSNNTISNNNIHDFFIATATVTNGILLSSAAGNLSNVRWTISNNKFYQSVTRTYVTTAAIHAAIRIGQDTGAVATGYGHTVTGNTIGFATNSGTGVYTMTGTIATRFIGININAGAEPTSIQNNTITAISLTTSSGATTTNGIFSGINVLNGNVNIGTVTGNTIGSDMATGAISTTTTTALAITVGISAHTNLSVAELKIANNRIGGFTASGSGSISGIQLSAGQHTITNNTIGSNATALSMNSPTVAAQSTLLNGIQIQSSTGSVSPAVITGNTVANFSAAGTNTAAVVRGILNSSTGPATITSNIVHDLAGASTNTTVAGSATAIQGICQTGASVLGATVDQNTVFTISATNATAVSTVVAGIGYSNPMNGTVTRNKIYDLRNASTGTTTTAPPMAIGILIRAALGLGGTFSNNMISLGSSQTTNTQFVGMMNSFFTAGVFGYYNSVHIAGTVASGALPSFAFLRGDNSGTAVATPVDIRNNILNNTRSGGTGKHYAIANQSTVASATGWGTNASNFNALNSASASTVGLWGSTDETFGNWKAASASDASSLSGISVIFADFTNGDLHLNFGVTPTALESGGTTIVGLATDFDAQTRPGPAGSVNGGATAPDIGADEFDGVPLDLTPPVISYTALANTTSTTNRSFSGVTVTDSSGVNITAGTRPRVYYKKASDAANTFNDNTSATAGWKFVEATGGGGSPFAFTIDYSLLFGGAGVATGDVVQYFVVAQDLAPTPNVAINSGVFTAQPASVALTAAAFPIGGSINTYSISPSINGTKTVCASGCDYLTLTGAGGVFADINSKVATANIEIQIAGDLTTGEDGTNGLNPVAEEPTGSNFTVKIYPTGVARLITSTTAPASGFIRLNAADRVTIDGSISGTGTDRSLTITDANTGATSGVVWLQSNGADGATNNTVKNLNVVGNSNTTTLIGIGSGSSTVSITSTGTGNNSNTIQNNNISKTQYGIYSGGTSAVSKNTGNVITQNLINTVSPNNVQIGGVLVNFESGIEVSLNNIAHINTSGTTPAFGITLGVRPSNTFTTFTGSEVVGALVSRNTIDDIVRTGDGTSMGLGVASVAVGATANTISNNFISRVRSTAATPSDFAVGLLLGGGATSSTNVYGNSISMTGSGPNSGPSFAIAVGGANPVVDLRDNIFYNTQTPTTGKTYAIALAYASPYTNLTSNFNAFLSTGTTAKFAVTGGLAGTDRTSLSAWQTETGKDGNSISADPQFASTSDLHLTRTSPALLSPVENVGTFIAAAGNDFDNDTRDASTPDIGADEVMSVNFSQTTYRPEIAGTNEGDTAIITVNRTSGAGAAATLNFTVGGGSATGGAACGAGVDYITPASLTLNFAAGDTAKSFNIVTCTDGLYEGNETVPLTLASVSGDAIIGTPNTATVNIIDGDSAPAFSIDDVSHNEGDAGTTSYVFTVTKTGATALSSSVNFTTQDGTAMLADNDYQLNSGMLTFGPTDTTMTITVLVNGDTNVEPDETFTVELSGAVNATISDGSGLGTITNDDIVVDYTVTTTGNAIVVTDVSGNSDTLAVSEPSAGNIKFAASGRFFSVDGGAPISGDSGDLSLSGINSITVNAAAGADTIDVGAFTPSMPSLTINGGTGDDTVNFNGNITFASDANLDVDLQNDDPTPGIDVANFAASANVLLSGTGTATVKVSKNITLNTGSKLQVANGNLTLEANQQAVGTAGNFRGILVVGTITTTGAGNVSLKGKGGADVATPNHQGISLNSGALVNSTSAAAGAGTITLAGTGGSGTTSNRGVEVFLGTVTSVKGDILLTGTGGTGGPNNYGVSIINGGVVSSTGAAKITFNGTGGNGTSSSTGSRISGEGTQVTSSGGDISITGFGGSGTSGSHHGVSFAFGSVTSATNGAKIIVNGTGGTGSSTSSGIIVSNFGPTTLLGSKVMSDSGDISFTGIGGSGGLGNIGWNIDTKATVVATGSASISISGTGGSGTTDNYGVGFESGGEAGTAVSAVNGNITITGVATDTTGTDQDGVRFEDSVGAMPFSLTTTGTGHLVLDGTAGNNDPTSAGINLVDDCAISLTGSASLIADTMDIGNSNVTFNAGANAVTVRQKTNGIAIDLGGADSATQLGLTDAELDVITTSQLFIGDGNSGAVTVSAPLTRPVSTTLTITSGANIDLPSSINSSGGNVRFAPGTNVFPSNSGVDVTGGQVSIASPKALKVVVNNTTADTGYTQYNIAGSVIITGVNLQLSGTPVLTGGESFVIVNNDLSDAIIGTFVGLPEGAVIPNFLGSGFNAKITYAGGSNNNDVVLNVSTCPTAFTVNSTGDASDANPGDGVCATGTAVCTLRAAIAEANATSGTCGPVNINFNIGSATITLGSELFINHSVNLNGPSNASVTVSGGNVTRVFRTNAAAVSLTNLTVTGGRSGSGAGLRVEGGTTTATNMLFASNTTINGSGGGAGVVFGTLKIYNSTISGNTATNGGGLYNGGGTLNLVNDTITNNNANGDVGGGACGVNGEGGGLDNSGASPTTVRNSIIAGNTACNTGILNVSGPITDQGNNILSGDPLLGVIENNGGPTFTHAVLYNSPAVDAGNDCVFTDTCVPALGVSLTTDQRGTVTRNADGNLVAGAHVDIGAYERQASESRAVVAGSNVAIDLTDARLTFPVVTRPSDGEANAPSVSGGTATIAVLDPDAQGAPPMNYSIGSTFNPPLPAFDVSTNASFAGPVSICFYLPAITDPVFFSRLRVLHKEGGVLVDPGSTVNFASKLVCTNVNSLSPFVIAHANTPTASNGSVVGHITDANGVALPGVAVHLEGAQNRLGITDSDGNFRFDEVVTGGFYTVTPARANYAFTPASRSFSQIGQQTEATFAALPTGSAAVNPLDTSAYFVRQQYLDFLGREPDEAGLNFWVNNIEACGSDSDCLAAKRTDTSAAFFLSIEFQQTGYLVYRLYESAYGDLPGTPLPLNFAEFRPDTAAIAQGVVVNEVGWEAKLEANKQAFASAFVARARFIAAYPTALAPAEFVDLMLQHAGLNPTGDVARDRAAAIAEFANAADTSNAAARARALRDIAENPTLAREQFTRAFVLMQYFGYLGRDPNAIPDQDFSGYDFWLRKLDNFNGDFRAAEMVRAFLVAGEYRARFPR